MEDNSRSSDWAVQLARKRVENEKANTGKASGKRCVEAIMAQLIVSLMFFMEQENMLYQTLSLGFVM